ncbi:MAG TPA: GNAT family N-acetyltransferase [Chitinophagales bacterium]|nr:GNAT family N-acetyltransferase [Chitinophagales bacterium]
MKLVSPSIEFKDSFLDAAWYISKEGNARFLKSYTVNFQAYCDALNNEAKGIGLAEGLIPQTTFWLIDNGNFIGRLGIRHFLNDDLYKFGGHIGYVIAPQYRRRGYGTKILELSLKEAAKLGLQKVLVTCDNTNFASARIIEKNGGVFENEMYNEETRVWKKRYWINVAG